MIKSSKKKYSHTPESGLSGGPSRSEGKGRADVRLILPVILAFTALMYANSLSAPFIFDDFPGIVENPGITCFWPFWPFEALPSNAVIGSRPFVHFTLALNHGLGGFKVTGYHLVNLSLHLCAAAVLFALIRKTLLLHQRRCGPHIRFASFDAAAGAVTLLWAVHPLLTETVTYVIQRTELLMGLLYFLTLYCAVKSWELRRQIFWSAAAILCCGLGMCSKEVMVTAPLVVLLYDRTFSCESFSGALRRSPWLYTGLAATWLLLAVFMLNGPGHSNIGFDRGITLYEYLLTESTIIARYLRLCFWPWPLLITYENWPVARSIMQAAPQVVLVPGLAVATAWLLWRRSWLGFCGAWFFLILAPTSSFIPLPSEPGAERRMYLPLAAVMAVIVIGSWVLVENRLKSITAKAWPYAAVIVMSCALLLGYGTVQRNRLYQNEIALWSDQLKHLPGGSLAHVNLCIAFVREHRIDEAIAHGRMAAGIKPRDYLSLNALANALNAQGKYEEVIDLLTRALEFVDGRPELYKLYDNLAGLLARVGRYEQAIAYGRKSLEKNPNSPMAHMNMAYSMLKLDRWEEAERHYRAYLKSVPDNMDIRYWLAKTLVYQNKPDQASAELGIILARDPMNEKARSLLDAVSRKPYF